MPTSSRPSLHPALTLWGYTPDPRPGVPDTEDWETARLAFQAGHYLALRTLRPEPGPGPQKNRTLQEYQEQGPLSNGWLLSRTRWRPILPSPHPPGPGAVEPAQVVKRLTAANASPGLRQLLQQVVRTDRRSERVSDGVAVTLALPSLPLQWMLSLRSGWVTTITGHPGPFWADKLPDPPGRFDRRNLETAMEWLTQQPGLGGVREAFHANRPDWARAAVSSLRYEAPTAPDLPERITLARLLYLYEVALRLDDQPVIELVADLRQLCGVPQ
ncbi:hypothetical protein [Streptomyces sp. NPDC057552]|uniref:hypothetical protein n=1 Tax=Streptomyces sp. NPDC057552 TaxID=3350537 RepID=UPI00367D5355